MFDLCLFPKNGFFVLTSVQTHFLFKNFCDYICQFLKRKENTVYNKMHRKKRHVCLRTGVWECLVDASLHLEFPFMALVSGHPRPPVVTAPVYRGYPCRDPLGCHRCPSRMASGAERQPLRLRCVGDGGTCHVDVAHTRVLQAHLLDS